MKDERGGAREAHIIITRFLSINGLPHRLLLYLFIIVTRPSSSTGGKIGSYLRAARRARGRVKGNKLCVFWRGRDPPEGTLSKKLILFINVRPSPLPSIIPTFHS